MSQRSNVASSIPAVEFRQNLGGFLNRVNIKGENFIIERDGKPLAAVISIYDLSRIKKLATDDMDNLFNLWSDRNISGCDSEDEIEKLVVDEIHSMRKNSKFPKTNVKSSIR